ncbi:MAG: hypothetical protein RLZZ153_2626 [Pseudomonadota bacterium]
MREFQSTDMNAENQAIRVVEGNSHVVFDSPHSGVFYPDDFQPACDLSLLRQAEDTHVEKIFDFAPRMGIGWVEAVFPRSYIDVNRAPSEIDTDMLDGPWPDVLGIAAPSGKVRLGKGLVWRCLDDGTPIYRRRLSTREVENRIQVCWYPYHEALSKLIQAAHQRHRFVIHINCHSMPSKAGPMSTDFPGISHPDFVLGDRDGTTASSELTRRMSEHLRNYGFSVGVNHPYKGVEIVRRCGQPRRGVHSIQLEINRALYMNEATLEMHQGASGLKEVLRVMAKQLLAERAQGLAPRHDNL